MSKDKTKTKPKAEPKAKPAFKYPFHWCALQKVSSGRELPVRISPDFEDRDEALSWMDDLNKEGGVQGKIQLFATCSKVLTVG